MPKHRPIKFKVTLEPSIKKELLKILKENKKAKTTLNATLALIALGGVLTCAVVAPSAFSVFSHSLQKRKKQKYEDYQKIWRNFHSLKKQGNLKFIKEEDGYLVYRPTKKGKERIKKFIVEEMILDKPKKWNNKWQLVIFDIPETKKRAREAFRNKLQYLGFYQCQKSVWIHPFPCMEEIEFLKHEFNIKPFVKLFSVDKMTDGKVLYHFQNLIKSFL